MRNVIFAFIILPKLAKLGCGYVINMSVFHRGISQMFLWKQNDLYSKEMFFYLKYPLLVISRPFSVVNLIVKLENQILKFIYFYNRSSLVVTRLSVVSRGTYHLRMKINDFLIADLKDPKSKIIVNLNLHINQQYRNVAKHR
jgi:hypothetical protein